MADDDAQRALQEVASIRGQVSLLHEVTTRLANRIDGLLDKREADSRREVDERKASRRYTLTTSFTACAITLTAIGLLVNALT